MDVNLETNGAFSASAGNELFLLYFDGNQTGPGQTIAEAGRWILMSVEDTGAAIESASFHFLNAYGDLDEALRAMAQADDFAVRLPNDTSFSRPGDVPALEVLHRMGFNAVKAVSAFVLTQDDDDADPTAVRLGVAQALFGTSVNVAHVAPSDRIGDASGWCVEILLPIEGVFHHSVLRDHVRDAVGDRDILLADTMAVEDVELPEPEGDNVISIAAFRRR